MFQLTIKPYIWKNTAGFVALVYLFTPRSAQETLSTSFTRQPVFYTYITAKQLERLHDGFARYTVTEGCNHTVRGRSVRYKEVCALFVVTFF